MNSLEEDDDNVGSLRKGFSYSRHQPSESSDIYQISSLTAKVFNLSRLRLLLLLSVGFLLLSVSISLLVKEESFSASSFLLFALLLTVLLVKKIFFPKRAHKESVLIIPDFGVQLETHYGREVVHRFIPIGKIVQPVLNECVTPVTCYWSLSLILRGEEELLLVFKELRPPVKMLVPIWKALCAIIDDEKKTPHVEVHLP